MSVLNREVEVAIPADSLLIGIASYLDDDQAIEFVKLLDGKMESWDFTRGVALWALEELRSLAVDELNEEEAGMATAAFSAASAVIARLEG